MGIMGVASTSKKPCNRLLEHAPVGPTQIHHVEAYYRLWNGIEE